MHQNQSKSKGTKNICNWFIFKLDLFSVLKSEQQKVNILAKINSKRLLKWFLFSFLFLAIFEVLGEDVPQEASAISFSYAVNDLSIGSEKLYDSDINSFLKFFEGSEIEEVEHDEDDYEQNFTSTNLFQRLSIPLKLNEITLISLTSPLKKVKLFILFHSWKSFLQN